MATLLNPSHWPTAIVATLITGFVTGGVAVYTIRANKKRFSLELAEKDRLALADQVHAKNLAQIEQEHKTRLENSKTLLERRVELYSELTAEVANIAAIIIDIVESYVSVVGQRGEIFQDLENRLLDVASNHRFALISGDEVRAAHAHFWTTCAEYQQILTFKNIAKESPAEAARMTNSVRILVKQFIDSARKEIGFESASAANPE